MYYLGCMLHGGAGVKLPNVALRFVGTTSFCAASKNIRDRSIQRTDRNMRRTIDMISGCAETKKKPWSSVYVPLGVSTSNSLKSQLSVAPPTRGSDRRAKQLSVVFNEYITSMISSGEVCPELVDLGFEVTKVRMLSDFGQINVYWVASDTINKEEKIVAMLPAVAANLRSALTGLRVIGNVPFILFVKDVTNSRSQEVERLLKIADMGPESDIINREDSTDDQTHSDVNLIENTTLNVPDNLRRFGNSEKSIQVEMERVGRRFEQLNVTNADVVRPDGAVEIGRNKNNKLVSKDLNVRSSTDPDKLESEALNVLSTTDPKRIHSLDGLDSTLKSSLRSNVYGLERDTLLREVQQMKRKSQNQSKDSGVTFEPESERGAQTETNKKFSTEKLERALARKNKKERLFRNADEYLSSARHRDVGDGSV